MNRNQDGFISRSALVLLALLGFFVFIASLGYWGWGYLLKKFPAYESAQTFISHHPMIEKKIGTIKQWDASPSGDFDYDTERGEGHLEIDIEGTVTGGTVRVELFNEKEHPWLIRTASLKTRLMADFMELETPKDWEQIAYREIDANNFEEATKYCNLIQACTPEDPLHYYCRAELELARGDQANFLKIREELSQKDQGYYLYQEQLAYAHRNLGRHEDSITYFRKAHDLKPDQYLATQLVLAYFELLDVKGGETWLRQAEANDYKHIDLVFAYGKYYALSSDYENAKFFFQQTLKEDPNYANAYFGLAQLNEDINLSDAIYYYEQGLARVPRLALKYRKRLVKLLIKSKYYDEAIYHLIQTTLYHGEDIPAMALLARVYEEQGRHQSRDIILEEARGLDTEAANHAFKEFRHLDVSQY